jgi:4-aminobutyrate--pyruvate transaminase
MNDKQRQYSERDRRFHVHSFTDLSQYEKDGSVIIDHGEGIYLIDSNGKRYLDAMSSLWCATLGYSEDRLVRAAETQLASLPYSHTFRGRSHPRLIELAEKIISVSPAHLTRVYFAGSGSEANESAIKIAWSYHKEIGSPDKRKIISRFNGYHGSTIFATRLSGMPSMHEYLNSDFPEVIYADCPNFPMAANEGESEVDYATRLAVQLESQILSEGAETIAAFIAEPVMGVGGVILPPATYFEKIQAVLQRHEILLIADEVICGFGRTGEMFGSTTFNIKPDILTVAKGITSAYFPMSAAIITESIYSALLETSARKGVFSHGFTYSGHPVGAAVALEAIAIMEERDIPAHVKRVGAKFLAAIVECCDIDIAINPRGVGLMAGFDLVADKNTSQKFDPKVQAGTRVMEIAEDQGLFVRAVGDTIVMAPPLIITEAEVDELIFRLGQSLQKALAELQGDALKSTKSA